MKFAECYPGQVIEAGPYAVDADEIVEFARRYDPQWFHTEPERAENGRFGGLIASGWHSCSIAMRLIVDAALTGSESFASPGLDYFKSPAPLRPGDRLSLRAEVIETRRSGKNPDLGILRWRWNLTNQEGAAVLELEATSFFDLAESNPG